MYLVLHVTSAVGCVNNDPKCEGSGLRHCVQPLQTAERVLYVKAFLYLFNIGIVEKEFLTDELFAGFLKDKVFPWPYNPLQPPYCNCSGEEHHGKS